MVIDPNIPESSKLFNNEIRNTIIKNGPKNPFKSVLIPKGFPCSFENGRISKENVLFPKYSNDLIIEDFKTANDVHAKSGWSSKAILEEFIENNFKEVKDSKNQITVFELKPTGAIEAVKKREQKKGHFISVLRGFGTTNQMRLLLERLNLSFTYPKPINLISYLIEAFSSENDIVLDSFAGSGTTANAVLQLNNIKGSNRKFILVELDKGNAHEVIYPRLKSVIKGNKIAKILPLGGGFKFYTLAPSLLNQDRFGQWVINKEYNPDMLAAAMAKQEGFRYAPNEQIYWKQGQSTEKDFIFTTTNFITVESLDRIQEEMQPEESLLICCKAFQPECENRHGNITLRKIPTLLLGKCEFGKDDYSLNIINLPEELRPIPEESESVPDPEDEGTPPSKTTKSSSPNQQNLF